MNLTELRNAISLTVEDEEPGFISSLDSFIQTAERRIYNTAQIPASERYATISINAQEVTMPVGYLSTNYVVIDAPLEPKDMSWVREAYGPLETGKPRYYAQKDENTLVFGPKPNAPYTAELAFFGYPESIVTATTTWLSENYPDALLYGALVEASIFLKLEADTVANYEKQFNGYITLLKQQVDGRVKTDEFRNGKTRVEVI